jgi:hypothetical protein
MAEALEIWSREIIEEAVAADAGANLRTASGTPNRTFVLPVISGCSSLGPRSDVG